jgi:hypothetical protein
MRSGDKLRMMVGVALLLGALGWGGVALPQNGPASVGLLEGLESGAIWAEFRGAGDSAVTGVIGRNTDAPLLVQIPPGTQFQAQAGGGRSGSGGSGSRQGMAALGTTNVDLTRVASASVTLPTACTNLGLPEPTASDVMLARACPDDRMASVMTAAGNPQVSRPAVQVAAWAIANDPPLWALQPFLGTIVSDQDPEAPAKRQAIVQSAAGLLAEVGVDPAQFRMFR